MSYSSNLMCSTKKITNICVQNAFYRIYLIISLESMCIIDVACVLAFFCQNCYVMLSTVTTTNVVEIELSDTLISRSQFRYHFFERVQLGQKCETVTLLFIYSKVLFE